jgi:hypothetical protein
MEEVVNPHYYDLKICMNVGNRELLSIHVKLTIKGHQTKGNKKENRNKS